MSKRLRPIWLVAIAAACFLPPVVAGPAQGAQRLETFELPSLQGNVDPSKVRLKRVTSLKASVLLPDGYDEYPEQSYPVLYLLHGGADYYAAWADPGTGNVGALAKGFPGIIVMPEAGSGSFADWWQGGARSGPRWTRYYLDEVFPTIEARYRVQPGRQNHAIGGLSMGAHGALFLGGQLPGYFGTIVSMSAVLDTQVPENAAVTESAIGESYQNLWGPLLGEYATAHNPIRTIANVALSRVYLSVGNGVPDPTLPFIWQAWTIGSVAEARLLASTLNYVAVAPFAGLRPTVRLRSGVHDWPYWRRELPKAIAWGMFGEPPAVNAGDARRWQYKTMEPAGNAWGIGYRFAAPTTRVVTFSRDEQTLTGTGGSGTVTINPGAADVDATGAGTRPDCSFTTTLPFERTLPPGC